MLHKTNLFLRNNASTILTCIGAAGVVVTTVMAVKATPKAQQLLEQAKKEKGEPLTKVEKVITVTPVYIPTVLVGASTIACVLSSNMLNKRKQAALTSAYALLDNSYKAYRGKVIELYGEEGDGRIKEEVAKDNYDDTKPTGDNLLFYDDFSGRYFESTLFKVQQAEYYLNRDLAMRGYVSANEYYDYLGLEPIEGGEELGWSIEMCMDMYWQNWIDFNHRKVTMDDGLECIMITFWQEPIVDFEDYLG